jgi:hypothetical protein
MALLVMVQLNIRLGNLLDNIARYGRFDMPLSRPLEQQFKAKTVTKIRGLIKSLQSLNVPAGPSNYYVFEIIRALETDLLLAAVELAASLLELMVRELVARLREKNAYLNHEIGPYLGASARRLDLEYERHLMFHQLVDELESSGIVTSANADLVRKFYREIRIPLQHGLTLRYVSQSQNSPSSDLLAVLQASCINSFEEDFEKRALEELKTVIHFIAVYSGKKKIAKQRQDSHA